MRLERNVNTERIHVGCCIRYFHECGLTLRLNNFRLPKNFNIKFIILRFNIVIAEPYLRSAAAEVAVFVRVVDIEC